MKDEIPDISEKLRNPRKSRELKEKLKKLAKKYEKEISKEAIIGNLKLVQIQLLHEWWPPND